MLSRVATVMGMLNYGTTNLRATHSLNHLTPTTVLQLEPLLVIARDWAQTQEERYLHARETKR
jgi:hypothetical protein